MASSRIFYNICAAFLAVTVIAAINFLPLNGEVAKFLVDKDGSSVNVFAIQNLMWILFFMGLAELFYRWSAAGGQEIALSLKFLPEDETTIMGKSDLAACYGKTKRYPQYILASLINLIISQFQTTKSVSMANDVLKSGLDLRQHEIDLKYGFVRYVLWAIPSIGFIGTVYGIAVALNAAKSMKPDDPELLAKTISGLSVAFYTTLLALLMSCLLVFLMGIIHNKEEKMLNSMGQYCLKNLINRLFANKE